MIVLNASVSQQFDRELASSGLVLEFRSYQMVTQAILHKDAQLAFHVAKSNITDVLPGSRVFGLDWSTGGGRHRLLA